MKKRVLFIDRDGTLIQEPSDEQVDSIDKIEYCPYVFSSLQKIISQTDFVLVIVTNQDGLGTNLFPESSFWPAHNKMISTFRNEDISFYKEHIDGSLPEENSPNRKPGTGMLSEYFSEVYDLKNSFVIGDRLTDIKLAQNLGAKGILYNKFQGDDTLLDEVQDDIVVDTDSWKDIADFLTSKSRIGTVERKTNETNISVEINLDGSGKSEISTGLAFFDHMLDQLARHGGIDIKLETKGDLEVDEHHTIEDTAIALGECFSLALGSKKGIERYGFMLPMDDCLAQVAIDFGGRNWIEWDAEFKREKIGEMPTEMFYHFFKSFSDSAKCNMNIKAEGTNEHHKIEAIFKAFARSLKMAIKKDRDNLEGLPTTKGTL